MISNFRLIIDLIIEIICLNNLIEIIIINKFADFDK